MKKIHVIICLSIFSLCFIFLQLYVVKYVSKSGKDVDFQNIGSLPHSGGLGSPLTKLTSQSYENVRVFASLCTRMELPVFLIDPPKLEAIMSNHKHQTSTTCHYLCTSDDNTALGILNSHWKPNHKILEELHVEGFDVLTVKDHHPQQLHVASLHAPEVPTHYMMARGGHTLHLVVFYERGTGYWWHGPLYGKVKDGNWDDLSFDLARLKFGKHPGTYERMDVVRVKVDGVTIYAPRYPKLFLRQVPHSRYIECNYTQAKQFHLKYGQDTSPDALAFHKSARNLLMQAKRILDNLEIRFWMSSGTFLGWYRQCDIITYSRDVDLGIWIRDYDVRLIAAMQMNGIQLKHVFGRTSDSYELSFIGGGIKLDIFFFYEEGNHMWNGGTQLRTGKKYKYYFPKFTLCWTEFLGLKIRVPCESKSYVEANYGSDWFTPLKQWDWKKSPPNVRENGKWPKEQLEKFI